MGEIHERHTVHPRGARIGWGRASAVLLLVVASAIVEGMGASCVTSDQFVCGVAREGDLGSAKLCDRKGEYCVCSQQRCAVRDNNEECVATGFRYSFGSEECVGAEDAKSVIAQNAGGPAFCPGNGPDLSCGVPGGTACLAKQACVCGSHRCAEWDTSCASHYRFAGTGSCVALEEAKLETFVFMNSGGGGLCPDEQPLPPPCGVPLFGAAPAACPSGQICVCASDLFRCAFVSPSCASGYAWAHGAACVEDVSKAVIEDPELRARADGTCPQYPDKDAGADGAPSDASNP